MNSNLMLEDDSFEIDLVELFHVLLHNWILILVVSVAGLLVSAGITKFFVTPEYQSQAMLYILSSNSDTTSMSDLQVGAAITEDFEIIATSTAVIDLSIEKIKFDTGVEFTRNQIREMVSVGTQTNTRILTIQAVSENPENAYLVAKAVSEATAERVAEIMKSDPPSMVAEAELPSSPIGPNLLKNAVLGFLVGAIVVCGFLIVQYLANDNIKSEDDITKYLGEATLVSIPFVKNKNDKKEELKRQKQKNGRGNRAK